MSLLVNLIIGLFIVWVLSELSSYSLGWIYHYRSRKQRAHYRGRWKEISSFYQEPFTFQWYIFTNGSSLTIGMYLQTKKGRLLTQHHFFDNPSFVYPATASHFIKRHSVDMKCVDMVSKKISEYFAVNHRLLVLIGLALSSKCQSDAVRPQLEEIFKEIESLTPQFERFITESYQEIKEFLALLDLKKDSINEQ